jgi:hypothetical protein
LPILSKQARLFPSSKSRSDHQSFKAQLENFLKQQLDKIKNHSVVHLKKSINHNNALMKVDYDFIISKISPSITAELVCFWQTLETLLEKEIQSITAVLVSEKYLQLQDEMRKKIEDELLAGFTLFEKSFTNKVSLNLNNYSKDFKTRLQSQLTSMATKKEIEDKLDDFSQNISTGCFNELSSVKVSDIPNTVDPID